MNALRHTDLSRRLAVLTRSIVQGGLLPLPGSVALRGPWGRIKSALAPCGTAATVVMLLAVGSPGAVEGTTSLSISPAPDNQFLLSWQSAILRPYQIETSQDLMTWADCCGPFVGDGGPKESLMPNLGGQGFYRLRIGAVRPGFDQVAMSRGDDHCYPQFEGPAAPVNIGFDLNLFGTTRSVCFVNNNGNVTFDAPLFVYTPESLIKKQSVMIAPLWADVDSRHPVSNVTRFSSQPTLVNGNKAFGVTWRDVGYFSHHVDKLNSFQLLLIERADRNAGDFDIEFNYNRIDWETGDASGGSFGFGGSVARVGWTNGQGLFMEYQGSGESLALLDRLPGGDPNFQRGLIYQMWNSEVPGRVLIPVVNGIPQTESGLNFSVNAGPDIMLPAGAGRGFSLAASLTPPATTGVSFSWVLESGVAEAVISNANSLTPSVVIPEPGQYEFRLYGVKQGLFTASFSDSVIVTHPGSFELNGGYYPLAEGSPLSVVLRDAYARFNGQGVATVHWTQISGDKASIQSPSNINPTVVLPHSGTYGFQLRAFSNHSPPFVKTVEATVVYGDS